MLQINHLSGDRYLIRIVLFPFCMSDVIDVSGGYGKSKFFDKILR